MVLKCLKSLVVELSTAIATATAIANAIATVAESDEAALYRLLMRTLFSLDLAASSGRPFDNLVPELLPSRPPPPSNTAFCRFKEGDDALLSPEGLMVRTALCPNDERSRGTRGEQQQHTFCT